MYNNNLLDVPSALSACAKHGNVSTMKWLFACIKEGTELPDLTVVCYKAILRNRVEIVQYLVNNYADLRINKDCIDEALTKDVAILKCILENKPSAALSVSDDILNYMLGNSVSAEIFTYVANLLPASIRLQPV